MPLLACEGCIKDIFVTETEFIDRFTGQELFTWGCGTAGVLGDDSQGINKSFPVQTVSRGTNWRQISGASVVNHATVAAIKTDGTLWVWGCGLDGRLGNDSTINHSSPVQTISGGTNWKQVSAGPYSMGAIKTDGTLWTWGSSSSGRLGDNTTINRSSPVQTVSGGTNWKSISVGWGSVSAIKTDGTLWVWGLNTFGDLGTGDTIGQSSPVQTISGGTNWKQISVGCRIMGAIKTDGTLWTWGFGTSGQLGDGSTISKSSPVQTVSSGNNWKSVSAGSSNMIAIKTDGTLWLWGSNASGQLGTGDRISTSSPVQTVSGGNNWRYAHTAKHFNSTTFGIKTDGTLWGWGVGTYGVFGNNLDTSNRSSPVQAGSSVTNWKSVSGGRFIAALRTEE